MGDSSACPSDDEVAIVNALKKADVLLLSLLIIRFVVQDEDLVPLPGR